jgi:type I restriction enzyme M protein
MWFQTLWHHLSERGTAGVVMANGAMTGSSAGEKNVREHMVRQGMVDCIVQMPDKLFLTTCIPACLFILSKNRDGRDGEHRERKKKILFIDARKLGHLVSRRMRVFSDGDVARIADTYHGWRNLSGSYADTEGYCKAATIEEVAANNYVLSPDRYVGSVAEEDDGVPFEEKMKGLTAELARQFEEGARLEKRIRENLEGIGFGIR